MISVTSGMSKGLHDAKSHVKRESQESVQEIVTLYLLRGMRDLCDICCVSTDASDYRWVPDTSTFGARLALVRQRMGWNLKEAALACGLPQASWREWELKGRDPRGIQTIVEKIAERTGVDDYWLLTGKTTPKGGPDGGGGGLLLPRMDSNHQPPD